MTFFHNAGVLLGAMLLTASMPANVQEHAQEHAPEQGCCAAPASTRASYVEVAEPLAPGVIGGKVSGKILFGGKERPKPKALDIGEKSSKGCAGGKVDATNRSLEISAKGGIRNAVVTIAVKGAKVKLPEKPIALDQIACRFEPHVLLIPAGATARFLNSDKISHNVHLRVRKNLPFNRMIASKNFEETVLKRAEAIRVGCDLHPWMECYLFVTDTPYIALTDAEGNFELPKLPPGEYAVKVWHEKLAKAKATVTVAADGSSSPIEVKLLPKKKR